MSIFASVKRAVTRWGATAAKSVVTSLVKAAIPVGGTLLADMVTRLFDTIPEMASEEALSLSFGTDLSTLGQILDVCSDQLADLGERIAEMEGTEDAVRKMIDDALARENDVREGFEKLTDLADELEVLKQQNREILSKVRYGNELAEGMLPLLQENQSIVVEFVKEARQAGLKPKDIIIHLSTIREQLVGVFAGHKLLLDRLDKIDAGFQEASRPATTSLLRAIDRLLMGQPRQAAQEITVAARRRPQDRHLSELSQKATEALPPETPTGGKPPEITKAEGPRIGDVLDGWKLVAQIGFGGWGAVYRAERAGKVRALKLLHPELSRDPDFVENFKREIQSLLALHATGRQPYLVVLDTFGFDERSRCWYLLMEYVEGESLQARLDRDGVLYPAEAVPLLAALTGDGGLATVHERGLVHRDIKPSNILVRSDGTPVLIDFGLALGGKHGLSLVQRVTGYTVDYAAPEQLRGHAADARSDAYSLTATLWKLLTGEKPEACDVDDLPKNLLPLREVLRLGLNVNAVKRHANGIAIAAALRAIPEKDLAKRPKAKDSPKAKPSRKRTHVVLPTAPPGFTRLSWEINAFVTLQHDEYVGGVAFSPDGRLLATGSGDRTAKLWNVASGKLLATFHGHSLGVSDVAFSPDGRLLATGSYDNTAKLWNVTNGKLIATLQGHSKYVDGVAFSPDSRLLATSGDDTTSKLWSVADGKLLATFRGHGYSVNGVAFSPDGRLLATGNDDKTAKLWNVADGKLVATFQGHGRSVHSVAFSPDGRLLATGSSDDTSKLWNVADGKLLATTQGHRSSVRRVAFSPDGRLLATSKLWNVVGAYLVATLQGQDASNLRGLAFSPDGRLLATGSEKTARLWNLLPANETPDWSYGEPNFTPRPVLRTTLSGAGQVYPGDFAWLRFEFANTGKGEFVHLWTELRSASPVLDGLRAYPGLVKPGETVERCLAAILPLDTPTGPLDAELVFHEANGHAPAKQPVRFDVQPLPRPDFVVSYRLVNDDSGNSAGNGDGQPKRSETIDVAVRLENGIGDSLAKVRVALRAVQVPSGVAVSLAEQIIDTLPDDGCAEVCVTFTVKPNAGTGPASFEIRVTTEDGRTFAVLPVETSIT